MGSKEEEEGEERAEDGGLNDSRMLFEKGKESGNMTAKFSEKS